MLSNRVKWAGLIAAALCLATPAEAATLELSIQGVEDEAPIVAAIMDELGEVDGPDEAARLDVVIDPKEVRMKYAAGDREALSRVIARPKSDEDLPEMVALLAGNLARDQAGPLLDELGAPDKDGAPEPDEEIIEDEPELAPLSEDEADDGEEEDDDIYPFQLALASPVAVVPSGKDHTFAFDVGLLYTHSGGLRGFGVNALVRYVSGDVYGFDASGIYSHRGGSLVGFAASGAVITTSGPFSKGFEASGIANIGPDTTFSGFQGSGLFNLSGPFSGLQVSTITNISDGHSGAQISLVNVSKQTVEGVQIGLFNYASRLEGVQIGLVNVASAGGLPVSPFLNIGW